MRMFKNLKEIWKKRVATLLFTIKREKVCKSN